MVSRTALSYLHKTVIKYPLLREYSRKLYYSRFGQAVWNHVWSLEMQLKMFISDWEFDYQYSIDLDRVTADAAGFYVPRGEGPNEIVGGDWDRDLVSFEMWPYTQDDYQYDRYGNVEVYHAIKQRFEEGLPWEETEFYQRSLERLAEGKRLWSFNATSREELDERCTEVEELYERIRTEGYQSQDELDDGYAGDEVSVLITRNGRYVFNDGIHRFAIAKVLGVETIPVVVTVRHEQWVQVHQLLREHTNPNGEIYQTIPHPDLSYPSIYDGERWELIADNLTTTGGYALDIGSKWGYMCHQLEKRDFHCTAVEYNTDHVRILETVKRAANREFDIYTDSVFEFDKRGQFDVVIALNIFHHFVGDRGAYWELEEFLDRLDIGELFLQVPDRVSDEVTDPYRNFDSEELCEFVITNCPSLYKYDRIGRVNERPVYKLW